LLLERRNGFGYTLSVCRVSLRAVADMTILDFLRCSIDRASRVVEEQSLLLGSHLVEKIARLLSVIIH
jgi:hypothetical protein